MESVALERTQVGTLEATLTPDELRAAMKREKELRAVVIEYMRDQMIDGYHYYYLNDDDRKKGRKPGLSKQGAANIQSLFKLRAEPEAPEIVRLFDNHMMCTVKVNIYNREGGIVSSGVGAGSTLETNYITQVRWMGRTKIPEGVDIDTLETREADWKGKKYTQYKVVTTQNPADFYNTVIKMAVKRATVDASLAIPLVSELFLNDADPSEKAMREKMAVDQDTRDEKDAAAGPLTVTKGAGNRWIVKAGNKSFTVTVEGDNIFCSCGSRTTKKDRKFCDHMAAMAAPVPTAEPSAPVEQVASEPAHEADVKSQIEAATGIVVGAMTSIGDVLKGMQPGEAINAVDAAIEDTSAVTFEQDQER